MSFLILLLALSLSMDAFSLSLAYAMSGFSKRKMFTLSFSVGVFHFCMPLLGVLVGNLLFENVVFNYDFLIFLILFFIGIQMIFDEENEIKGLKNIEIILFSFAVSIDSFAVGITLPDFNNHYFLSAFIFSIFSSFFTFLGLNIGNKTYEKLGKVSKIIGGIILIVVSIFFLF